MTGTAFDAILDVKPSDGSEYKQVIFRRGQRLRYQAVDIFSCQNGSASVRHAARGFAASFQCLTACSRWHHLCPRAAKATESEAVFRRGVISELNIGRCAFLPVEVIRDMFFSSFWRRKLDMHFLTQTQTLEATLLPAAGGLLTLNSRGQFSWPFFGRQKPWPRGKEAERPEARIGQTPGLQRGRWVQPEFRLKTRTSRDLMLVYSVGGCPLAILS